MKAMIERVNLAKKIIKEQQYLEKVFSLFSLSSMGYKIRINVIMANNGFIIQRFQDDWLKNAAKDLDVDFDNHLYVIHAQICISLQNTF
jgi:hypothetical protein